MKDMWRDISDQWPFHTHLLVWIVGDGMPYMTCAVMNESTSWLELTELRPIAGAVTHWQPLPTEPTE